eukprot:m.58346 g.58346  ORF g.58346 m.58346 type:complete len:366 (+) comp15897_c0_seq2:163-1260(+)
MALAVSTPLHSSDSKDASIQLWDTGSGCQVASFRGGACAPHGLCVTENLIFGLQVKQAVHVWRWTAETPEIRIPLPEKITSLTASFDGTMCFCGSESGSLLVWEVATGQLLNAVKNAHYRKVNVCRLTADESHVITASDDAVVRVWRLASLLDKALHDGRCESRFTWSDHALPVTDVFCGLGSGNARVVTASRDRTCKLYELTSGILLASVTFPTDLVCVCMDPIESMLFAGGSNGCLFKVQLQESREAHAFKEANDVKLVQSGQIPAHSKSITALCVLDDGSAVMTASEVGFQKYFFFSNGNFKTKIKYLFSPKSCQGWLVCSVGVPIWSKHSDLSARRSGVQSVSRTAAFVAQHHTGTTDCYF